LPTWPTASAGLASAWCQECRRLTHKPKVITTGSGDVEAALKGYEEAMFAPSAAEAADAHETMDLCLGDRAPFGLIEFLWRQRGTQCRSAIRARHSYRRGSLAD
jgi:hypothetical protein